MPVSPSDHDQPGLWPIAQTASEVTAKPAKRQRGAPASKAENQSVRPRADGDLPDGQQALWRVDDVASYLAVPRHTIC
jgi:hypothetical protein